MYLANYTRPNITLFVNLQDIVLHQLIDIGIKSIMYLITWVYVILKDHNLNCLNMQTLPIFQTPTKLISNEVCIYLWCTTISWRSIKQIMETCGLPSIRGNATKLYNIVCIAEIKERHIKGDKIKHISLKFFYIHQLQKSN